MFLFITIFLVLLFWVISIFFGDIEDSLQFRQSASIFDWINKTSWWSWYMVDPDWAWKRKYIDGDPEKGTKKFLGLTLSFLYDGWHGAKIIRKFFQFLTIFTTFIAGYSFVLSPFSFYLSLSIFIIGLFVFAILNHFAHDVWFFDGIFLKEWWKKREKEKIIKKWLDKVF